MILHRIVAANVGPFVGAPVTAGPFAPGLNILSARNETGKTTLLKAAGRALFDRHTCRADEIKNLRPAGTSLSPVITVEFETSVGRFRIEKTFLQSPRSQLSEAHGAEWKLIADGDSADDRLNALLQSTRPGRGATDAAHWGMLGYLWMRQGELSEWPEWDQSAAGQTVQGMLVKVEIDPVIATVCQRLWAVFTENFTPSTNQPKVGGELLRAEENLARATTELAEVECVRRQMQSDQDVFDGLSADLPRLEEEHRLAQQHADALRQAAARADVLKVEVERRRHVLATARDRLHGVENDERALRDQTRQADELTTKTRVAQEEAARCALAAATAQENLRLAESARDANAQTLAAVLAEQTRLGQRVRHDRLTEEVARDSRTLERCVAYADALANLTAERAEVPTITTAKLARFEKLRDSVLAARAKVEALGLTIDLLPSGQPSPASVRTDDKAAETLPLTADRTHTVHAAQELTLDLPGWGTIRVRSGAGEARTLRESLAREEEILHQELAAFGVATPVEARALAARAHDLDARLETAQRALSDAIGSRDETVESLRSRLAQNRRQYQLLATELAFSPAELSASSADLEALEQALIVRCDHQRSEAKALERRVKESRETFAQVAQLHESAGRAVLGLVAEESNLRTQMAAIQARYSAGLKSTLDQVREEFALATYELKQAETALPPDAATLPEHNRRASNAAEQISVALNRTRNALSELRGRLELQGSSGLHTRENDLRIRQEALAAQVTQARSRSRAARVVHDLIERRKQAATRSVLAPLQERLGARFAEISGDRDRRIFLDENLVIRGLGRKEEELISFSDLSQGAKEQLLLCLRVAIAEELVAGGGGAQSLVLDDVLVNTDAARQERVLTMLGDAAHNGLQIMVCTCHPERYRGVGETIELKR